MYIGTHLVQIISVSDSRRIKKRMKVKEAMATSVVTFSDSIDFSLKKMTMWDVTRIASMHLQIAIYFLSIFNLHWYDDNFALQIQKKKWHRYSLVE